MRRVMARCKDDKGDKNRCFKLVLPVTFTMSDGSEAMYIMNGDGTAPTDSTGFTIAIGAVITIWRQATSVYYVWGAGIP